MKDVNLALLSPSSPPSPRSRSLRSASRKRSGRWIVGPGVATAAEVKARVRAALATVQSLSGTVIADGRKKGDEVRWRFLMTAEGDFASGQLSRAELIRITEALERRP